MRSQRQRSANRVKVSPSKASPSPATHAEEYPTKIKTEPSESIEPAEPIRPAASAKPSYPINLSQNWGEARPQRERNALPQGGPKHYYLPIKPPPNGEQMEMTKDIWNMIPEDIAIKFGVPPTDVTSEWINEATNAMWEASPVETRARIGVMASADYSLGKLRLLGATGFLISWWWMREGLVWTLLQQHLDRSEYNVYDHMVAEQCKTAHYNLKAYHEKNKERKPSMKEL